LNFLEIIDHVIPNSTNPIPYDIINLYKTIILKLGISRRVNPGPRTRIGPDLKKKIRKAKP
jgi:hypothetical protein